MDNNFQNQNNSSGATPGFSNTNMDVPPIPVSESTEPSTPLPVSPVPVTTEAAVPQAPEPVSNMQSSTPPPPPPPPAPLQNTSVVTSPKKSFFSKKILIVVGIVIAIVTILSLAIRMLSSGRVGSSSTITWWGLWETEQTVKPLIDEYQSAHPGVTIKYTQESKEQYRERLVNSLAQGNGPDILTIHNSWVPMLRSYLSPIPQTTMTAQEYSQTFYPVITGDMTLGASLVSIQTGYDGLALYINDEIFSNYGKTAPKTWNELRETAISLTIKDEKGLIRQSGVALGTTSNIDDWQEILALLMIQNGASLSNPTGVLAEGALNYYTLFTTADGVWNDTLPNSTLAFANGTVAMIIAPSWRVHDIKAINPNLKFHLVAAPQLPKNTPDEPDITYATYWANAVSNKSKAQTQAWDFLKFLSTKESYQKLYQNASATRTFGQPYPRIDMRDLVSADPYVGGIISLAGNAKSWYLSGKTWDGETGINSRINKYFENAINAVLDGKDAKASLGTASQGVTQVLVDFGLATPIPTPKK